MIELALDGLVAQIDPHRAVVAGLFLSPHTDRDSPDRDGHDRPAPLLWPTPPQPASDDDNSYEILDRTPLSARFIQRGPVPITRRFEIEPGALRIGMAPSPPPNATDGHPGDGSDHDVSDRGMVLDLCRCPFAMGDPARIEAQDGLFIRLLWLRRGVTLALAADRGRVELRTDTSIDDPYLAVALLPDTEGAAEATLTIDGGVRTIEDQ